MIYNPKYKKFLITLVFALFVSIGYGQSNLRIKKLILKDTVVKLDTLSISPIDFVIKKQGEEVSILNYKINYVKAELTWKSSKIDTIEVKYRVLPIDLNKKYNNKDLSQLFNVEKTTKTPIRYSLDVPKTDLFNAHRLSKTGSLSRGVLFGSAQDLSLNSNLNLQLTGAISNDIEIVASITDDNLPIQPEGNTQQLNNFDQVYIKLFSGDKWKLQAGDFWLKKPKGYFLKYYKRAQGGSFSKKTILKNKNRIIKNRASAAISKGKFSRNVIQGIEGNQGAYKLKGADNEQFIIILSGTERVYIDGRLKTRGAANDYTIDYNTAEITFTTNQIITKDKRIIVEFQYSDKNYARSIVESSNEFIGKKSDWWLNVYSEQDAKNQPLQQNLSKEEKNYLANLGDNLNNAYFPSVDSVEYNSNQVMYKKIDSLGYQIFKYSTNEDSAKFQLSFSKTQGDYELDGFSPFGKKYKWIAPDTVDNILVHKGSYAPVKTLITPQKRQLITLGTKQQMNRNTLLKVETAMSNKDVNTFSELDKNDNVGFGFTVSLQNKKDSIIKNWSVITEGKAEVITEHFNWIERYRAIEFTRDWNTQGLNAKSLQTLANFGVTLEKQQQSIKLQSNTYQIDKSYEGYKNSVIIKSKKGIDLDFNGSLLISKSLEKTNYLRHKTYLSKNINKIKLGFNDVQERNKKYNNDSLKLNSYQFYEWKTYISNSDTSKSKIELFYGERYNKKVKQNKLTPTALARNPGLKINYQFNKNHKIRWTTTYRMLKIKDTLLTNIKPENTLLNRVNHNLKLLKGAISLYTYYEVGSGLELKKEFTYIEVVAGQGIYTWNDYNDDGIKDINEFETAVFSDQAKYIRVFTPSQNYIKTYNNSFNEVMNINPRYLLKKKTKINKLINKFSSQTSLRTNRKTTLNKIKEFANPFVKNIADSNLQTLNNSFRNSIYFNRSNAKFGIEQTYLVAQNKILLANGFDARTRGSNSLKIRWNITKMFLVQLQETVGTKVASVDYAANRNYNIASQKSEIKLAYQPSTKLRIAVTAKYEDKQNKLPTKEKAFINNYGIELKYNQLKRGIITASFNYINNKYIGEENNNISFQMLNALQEGINYTWNCSIQRTLANNLQLSLNYTGRDSKKNKTIHTGGIQVRAFF